MKKIIFLFGFFISTVGFAQINSFNETTQLLNKPHGKPVLQINAGVEYNYYYPDYADVWREISVSCYAKKSDINKNIIASGSVLYDYKNDSVGCVLQKCSCSSSNSYLIDCENPDTAQFTMVGLSGYIEDEKLQNNQTVSEIISLNNGFADSCQSRIFDYRNTIGVRFSIVENCEIKFPFIKQGNDYKQILVKEKTKTLMPYGNADGDFRSMVVEIVLDYDTDNPKKFVISNEAYKCEFDYNKILFYEYNWSAGPEEKYLYSVSTFNQLFNFHGDLYSVMIPETEIIGFIGYLPNPYERDSIYYGNLCFATPNRVLLNKQIICRNKELVEKLTCFDAKIKFVAVNKNDAVSNYDSTLFLLKSKSSCAMENCLTDFRIIMSMGYDLYDISLELEFRDGDVFIVKNYLDAFELK